MKKLSLYFTLLFLCVAVSLNASAQERTLQGQVTDSKDGQPVPGVIVTLRNAENRIVRHVSTDSKGNFTIRTTSPLEGMKLHFAMMGYAPHSIPAEDTAGLKVTLSPAATDIREVQVKAPEIMLKGDTLVYDVSKYTAEQDRAIGDVIRKLPGVEVKESGQIEYQGKPINKLYIEGNDLVGGQHNLATKNISAKDVKSVEIMENHQPIKAIQDIEYSENAGMNLKLHDHAKGRWVGTAGLGVGFSPLLAHGSLFGMRIGKGWQGMQNLKANNYGANLSGEVSNFSLGDILNRGESGSDLRDYISVGTSSAPLAGKRTRFSHSVLASSNNSRKISDDYKVDIRANYVGEKINADNSRTTTYFFEDGSELTLEDTQSMTSRNHLLHGEVGLEANTEKFFLTNKLTADAHWKESDMDVTGTTPNRQSTDLPSTKISNNFQLVSRKGTKMFTVTSLNQYMSKPHSLTVEREGSRQYQDIAAKSFHSNTNLTYGWNWRRWQLSARAGFTANLRWLESELTGVDIDGYTLENNSLTSYMRGYILPSLTYRTGRLRATLSVPLNYYHYKYDDRHSDDISREDEFITAPSLNFSYNISSKWTVNANATVGKRPVEESNFYSGLILSSYRSLQSGIIDYRNGKFASASAGFQYKNPIKSLFFNGSLSYGKSRSVYTNDQLFVGGGDYIVNTLIPYGNTSDNWSARGGISKGLDRIKGLVAIDASYSSSKSAMVREGLRTPFTSESFSVTPRINGRIFKWCNAEYRLTYNHYVMDVSDADNRNTTDNYSQSLTLSFYPFKKFNFGITGEHYYAEISSDKSKHTLFIDVNALWRVKDKWEVSVSATNLLDRKEYAYVNLGSLTSTRAAYKIRPRNVIFSTYFRF